MHNTRAGERAVRHAFSRGKKKHGGARNQGNHGHVGRSQGGHGHKEAGLNVEDPDLDIEEKKDNPGDSEQREQEKKEGEERRDGGKYEVTNQKEIDEAREKAFEAKEKRKEIIRSVESSLAVIDAALKKGKLNPEQKKRYEWLKKAALDAKAKSWDQNHDRYKVELANGQSRLEGIPVDELYNAVEEQKVRAQQEVQKLSAELADMRKLKTECVRASAEFGKRPAGDENYTKQVYFEIYQKLEPGNPLRRKAEDKVAEWQSHDAGYSEEEKKHQLGQATREVVNDFFKHQAEQDTAMVKGEKSLENRQKNLAYLNHVAELLEQNSLPYFDSHYGKGKAEGQLTPEEQRNQHGYTEREASLISQDRDYKDVLFERYRVAKKLPEGFDHLPEDQQNYELAKLALRDRIVLKMPDRVEIPPIVCRAKEEYHPEPVKPRSVSGPVKPREDEKQEDVRDLDYNPHHEDPRFHDVETRHTGVEQGPVDDVVRGGGQGVETGPIIEPPKEIKAVLVDVSEIAKRMAWTKAEEKLRKQFDTSGGRFKRAVKNAWKGMSENYYRLKFYQEALDEIKNDGDLMKTISGRINGTAGYSKSALGDKGDYYRILDSVAEEYKHDAVDVQREIGDKLNEDPDVKAKFAEMLYAYQTQWSGIADERARRGQVEDFVRKEIVTLLKQKNVKWTNASEREQEAKGLLYANNFYELLKEYKTNNEKQLKEVMEKYGPENEKAIRDHFQGMMKLDLQLGLKERDLVNNRPKGILSWYEKLANKAENHPILSKIVTNPLVMGAAASATTIASSRVFKWGLVTGAAAAGIGTGFWIPIGAGAVVGGAMRYFKRSKDIKYDIAQEQRHETLGGKGSTLLDQKGGLRYAGVMDIREAVSDLQAMYGKPKDQLTPADLATLAGIKARLQIEQDALAEQGRKDKLPHVDFFKVDETEGRRYGTTQVAKSELRIAVAKIMKEAGLKDQDLEQYALHIRRNLMADVEDKNKNADSYRRWQAFHSAWKGAAMGVAGGLVAQEAIYGGGRLMGINYFKNHSTSLEHIVQWGRNRGDAAYETMFGAGRHEVAPGAGAAAHPAVETYPSGPSVFSREYWQQHGFTFKTFHQDLHHGLEGEHFDTTGRHAGQEMMGQIVQGRDGSVSADFHRVLENMKVNIQGGWAGESPDSTRDPRFMELIRTFKGDAGLDTDLADYARHFHEHMRLLIYPNEAMAHARQGIEIALDSNGRAAIPKEFIDGSGNLRRDVVIAGAVEDGDGKMHILSSWKGHGAAMEQGVPQSVREPEHPDPVEPVYDDYDRPIVTVPPSRKVYLRPEDKGYKAEKEREKRKQEKVKKAEEEKDHGKGHNKGHDHADHHANDKDHGKDKGGEKEKEKETDENLKKIEELQKEFKAKKKEEEKYFDKAKVAELAEKYKETPAEFKKKAKLEAVDEAIAVNIADRLEAGKSRKWLIRPGERLLTRAQYLAAIKKMDKAVSAWEEEKAKKVEKEKTEKEAVEKKGKEIQDKVKKGDEAAKEIAKAEDDKAKDAAKKKFKEATGVDYWDGYTKEELEKKLRGDKGEPKDKGKEKAGSHDKHDKDQKHGKEKPDESKDKGKDVKGEKDEALKDIMEAGDKLIQKWHHKIHFDLDSISEEDLVRNKQSIVKSLENLEAVLDKYPKDKVEQLLKGKGGLKVKFATEGHPTVRNQELTLWVRSSYKGIKEALDKRLGHQQNSGKSGKGH